MARRGGVALPKRPDPWRRAPTGELSEQLLPRWFVLLAVVMVPVALAVFVAALLLSGPDELPVALRRPPPTEALTNDVGRFAVGTSDPVEVSPVCPRLSGIATAGSEQDRDVLRRGLAAVCRVDLPPEAERAVEAFARAGGVVRFAQFEATGVDSTAQRQVQPPVILLNAKFAGTEPLWTAPLVVHDALLLAADDPAAAETALAARAAEDAVCDQLRDEVQLSRGCVDAARVLALPDPIAALRDAGFR